MSRGKNYSEAVRLGFYVKERQRKAELDMERKEIFKSLPWRLNSAWVPGGKNSPGCKSTSQFPRLVVAEGESWVSWPSQISRRIHPSSAGTS